MKGEMLGESVAIVVAGEPCQVCYVEVAAAAGKRESCGHILCNECRKMYFDGLIQSRAREERFVCPVFGCTRPITRGEIAKICGLSSASAFALLIAEQKRKKMCPDCNTGNLVTADFFVHDILHCSSPECHASTKKSICLYCEKGIDWNAEASLAAKAYAFCCSTQARAHNIKAKVLQRPTTVTYSPFQDYELLQSIHKCADSSACQVRKFRSTQPDVKHCPQCFSVVEKNLGCSHMHCAYCDYHFCWACLGSMNHSEFAGRCPAPPPQIPFSTKASEAVAKFVEGAAWFCTKFIFEPLAVCVLICLSPIIYPAVKIQRAYARYKRERDLKIFAQKITLAYRATVNGIDIVIDPELRSSASSDGVLVDHEEKEGELEGILSSFANNRGSRGRWMTNAERLSPNLPESFRSYRSFLAYERTHIVRIHLAAQPSETLMDKMVNQDLIILTKPSSLATDLNAAVQRAPDMEPLIHDILLTLSPATA